LLKNAHKSSKPDIIREKLSTAFVAFRPQINELLNVEYLKKNIPMNILVRTHVHMHAWSCLIIKGWVNKQ